MKSYCCVAHPTRAAQLALLCCSNLLPASNAFTRCTAHTLQVVARGDVPHAPRAVLAGAGGPVALPLLTDAGVAMQLVSDVLREELELVGVHVGVLFWL